MGLFHLVSTKAASSRLTKRSRGLLLRAALALVLTVCLLQLFLHVWRTNNNGNGSPPPKHSADQHVKTSLAPKTLSTRRSPYLGDSSPSESQHLSRRIISASRHIAFRRNNNISLCVGIPLRQLDRVDDTFAFALKDAIAYANLSHVVLGVAVNRGEEGLKEVLRLQHEVGGASSAYAARHITLLPLSQAQTNATLGAMLNVLLQRFATFDTEAAAAAPTSGPACSHMMFLDPSRTVMSETFFVTLIQDVELAAGAYAATCTTYRHGVDGAEPRVFDRGFNVSLGQSLGSTRPTMSRVFFGYSKRRDARLHSASPIEFLSPHCFLVNWRRLVTAATPSFSSSFLLLASRQHHHRCVADRESSCPRTDCSGPYVAAVVRFSEKR
ncbi:transmembrane protein, putative [Bodo saltans]|uniref:Transmembrane protein, putative n=1 Tax=Bodo saltans TaxID=75058 RepID=A0A0S4JN15_BODSA|nr:transmembrane protein, putative [Bodo saltans]|eukprot:CUG91531.1 transmembrane protein, putative [Bodo saltans]